MQVRALHPDHTAASVAAILPRLKYYEEGTCIVHHIFGGEVRPVSGDGSHEALIRRRAEATCCHTHPRDHTYLCPHRCVNRSASATATLT